MHYRTVVAIVFGEVISKWCLLEVSAGPGLQHV